MSMSNVQPNEHSPLLDDTRDNENPGFALPAVTKEESALADSSVGERLPYNDYTTIDWLHDLVKDSYRYKIIHGGKSLRSRLYAAFDASSGWIVAIICGTLTALVAFLVDIAEATVSDWKKGYCSTNPLKNEKACCKDVSSSSLRTLTKSHHEGCPDFHEWSTEWYQAYGIYVAFAVLFGIIAGSVTLLTKRSLPAAAPGKGDTITTSDATQGTNSSPAAGKTMYMAAGSGIPEIKTHLSGFVIPHFLSLRVLVVKAIGATFAVATGMCLGKEGPFVHISGCVGNLVGMRFEKYRNNGRKLRELLSAAVAAGMSVAFGAPIGGVLFSYEEISTYFPRKVLWRAFLTSAVAAMVLKTLNPTGTGKLILFETHFEPNFNALHYLVFVFIGVVGGIWGGTFCKLNYIWSRWFRSFPIIKQHPVFELALITLVTATLQFPNPLVRAPGDEVIRSLIVDCYSSPGTSISTNSTAPVLHPDPVCAAELAPSDSNAYRNHLLWLVHGTLLKLLLTIITFGAKVPSGIIIPSMDAGALFGRLLALLLPEPASHIPGLFAMVGAGAFLAGVTRMTVSLAVILVELTGSLTYVLPHAIALLTAKWTADWLSGGGGVYDLAQAILGHPFLDADHAMSLVVKSRAEDGRPHTLRRLCPPQRTMEEITVVVNSKDGSALRSTLESKARRLREPGLLDAGLVVVEGENEKSDNDRDYGVLKGYIAQSELEHGLSLTPSSTTDTSTAHTGNEPLAQAQRVKLIDAHASHSHVPRRVSLAPRLVDAASPDSMLDLTPYVDRTPITLSAASPLEYAVEVFAKLGVRHLIITSESDGGKLVGVVIKKRLVGFLEGLGEKDADKADEREADELEDS